MAGALFADLHNHTLASDGDFSPEELVDRAKKYGLCAIGITDHDTLKGLAKGLAAGEAAGIRVVPGVELSIRFNRSFFTGTLHLLCYFLPNRLSDEDFVGSFEALMADGRGEGLVRARIAKINAVFGPAGIDPVLGRDLVFEDIAFYSANASRRHFALALSEKMGITDKNTINRIIGNDSPAYLPSGIELDGAAKFIKKQHLLAVLAHPAAGSFTGKGHYKEVLPPMDTVETLLPEFLAAGISGIEVYYPGHTKEHQAVLLSWAEKHHLLVTGGSDCHDSKERPPAVAGISEADFHIFLAALS
ncbi:MAG: PHP domain-containing protein [Desulfotignum sp.]|nr:PHP domain-containing protein [Desulfotignum sp.]